MSLAINKITYGSIMSKEHDLQLLNQLTTKFCSAASFDADFSMSFSPETVLSAPMGSSVPTLLAWIDDLPNEPDPRWCGLPENTKTVQTRSDSRSLLAKLLELVQS